MQQITRQSFHQWNGRQRQIRLKIPPTPGFASITWFRQHHLVWPASPVWPGPHSKLWPTSLPIAALTVIAAELLKVSPTFHIQISNWNINWNSSKKQFSQLNQSWLLSEIFIPILSFKFYSIVAIICQWVKCDDPAQILYVKTASYFWFKLLLIHLVCFCLDLKYEAPRHYYHKQLCLPMIRLLNTYQI